MLLLNDATLRNLEYLHNVGIKPCNVYFCEAKIDFLG